MYMNVIDRLVIETRDESIEIGMFKLTNFLLVEASFFKF